MHLIKLSLFLLILLGFQPIFGQNQLTLEDIFGSDKFNGKTISSIQWRPDGEAFTFTKRNEDSGLLDIYEHSVVTGENTLMIAGNDLQYNGELIQMSSYQWTEGGKYILLAGPVTQIYRRSSQAPYYLYEVATKKLTALANGDDNLRNVKLSPDGEKVGYVQEYNIYVVDLASGKKKAITKDGNENILNGEPDWVYEEEFSLADAWHWSPDGSKIAFWRTDQGRVKNFYLVDELHQYNEISPLKYPKAGEKNAIVQIGMADVNSGNTVWADLGEETNMYIPRIFWTNDGGQLAVMRLNRHQNFMELLMINPETGEGNVVIADEDEAWLDVDHKMAFLQQKEQIVWTSEKSGFRHIYIQDYDGNQINQITDGDWEVSDIVGIDEKKDFVYFYGKKDSHLEQNLYRVKLNGKKLENISGQGGWHTAKFSPDYEYFVGSYSNVSTPTQISLRKSDGTFVRMLEENAIAAMKEYNMVFPEFLTFTTTDGTELHGYMMKPHDFDPAKKYPVLVYGYGGPASQIVLNRWGGNRTLWHQYMTEQGYIVFCVDNRGTGGRGKAFKNLAYGDLSKWAVHDQIEGAKYLATLPYVDADRLGFWGWSGGGYLTLMMLTRGADYFKAGVSVAPVSDFRLYDTIWTERYMGLPGENEDGYKDANALNYAGLLEGDLLIVHGTGDDNVHYQNALQMINALQAKNKQFEMMLYANRNHRISGGNTQLHLFTKISRFLKESL